MPIWCTATSPASAPARCPMPRPWDVGGVALGPAVIKEIHGRIVQKAQARNVVQGKMRVDTTVVENNIHYPTDSSLLGDGVRVLTRSMRKITELAGTVGAKLRDRSRSVKWRMLEIARAARGKSSRDKLETAYSCLLQATGRVVGQAKRFSRENGDGVKHCTAIIRQDSPGRPTSGSRHDGAAGSAGHAPNQGPHSQGRDPQRGQDRQHLRCHRLR